MSEELKLPWHRETIGHANIWQIAAKIAASLAVPLDEGIPPHTDATWIVNADDQIVAFVGNGPRQTENADAIIAALASGAVTEGLDVERLAEAMDESYTVEDDEGTPTLPFIDDHEGFWRPFAAKVLARLLAGEKGDGK